VRPLIVAAAVLLIAVIATDVARIRVASHDARVQVVAPAARGWEASEGAHARDGVAAKVDDKGSFLGARPHPLRYVRLDTTAYCETGSRTASGVWPRPGMAASNLFAFGTVLHVPGVGRVVVTDRIGWGSELDIYMGGPGCERRALLFGRRQLLVGVVR
jgi:3D (Asp-Asp-Asp) domain-containing protein